MRYRNQKIIIFILIGSLLVGSSVLAKNFTIYNAANVNQPYFSVNGVSGNVGIGITNPTTPLQLLNNSWISAQNNLGTGVVNMFKVNVNNQIEVGAPLNIGSFEFSPDSGLVTFVDMPVTSAPAAGTSESYVFKVDGDNIMTVYSESNGLGGVQNKRVGIGTLTPKGALDILGGLSMGTYAGVNAPPTNGLIVSGNVGIGTTAPNDDLSIGSAGVAAPAGSADTGHNYTSSYLGTDNYALTNYGLVKSLIGSATSTMPTLWGGSVASNIWSLNTGNVGIGTTNPNGKLDVGSPTGVYRTTLSSVANFFGADVTRGQVALYSTDAAAVSKGGSFSFGGENTVGAGGTSPYIFGQIKGAKEGATNTYNGYLSFSTVDATSGIFERMRIDSAGKVGIGITNPGQKLEVNGNISILGTNYLIQPDVWGMKWNFAGTSDTMEMNQTNTAWQSNINAGGVTRYRWNTTKNTNGFTGAMVDFNVDGSNIFYGNVGIGTTAPNDKLSIGSGGLSAPAGSADTGHNYTSSYLGSDDYALTNYGLVRSLIGSATSSMSTLWGGTIGGNVWSLNSGNIGINTTTPLFKFDINGSFRALSANISNLVGGVVMADASGNLYATSTLPSGYSGKSVYVGPSATSTTGNNNGNAGYDATYAFCETDYPGSHVCTPDDMLNNIKSGSIYPNVNVWIFSGPPGYTASANDCNGRRGAAASDLGAYWEGLTGSFPKGRGLLMACNQSLKIACCR